MKSTILSEDNKILALLELASSFAGKNDVRNYLNTVQTRVIDDKLVIVASDGHKLVKITLPVNPDITLPESISLTSIQNALKTKLITLVQPEVVSNYPDYERLIPKERTMPDRGEMVGINALYLAQGMTAFSKAFKKLAGDKFAGVKITQLDKNQANIFEQTISGNIEVLMLIMPMRL